VYVWKVKCIVNKGQRILKFNLTDVDKEKWLCLHITDLAGWMVYETDAAPPCAASTKGADGRTLGIVAKVIGQPMPLLKNSGKHCFNGMTSTFCTKLIKFLEVDISPMPTLESDIIKVLLKEVFPEFNEEQMLDTMSKRHMLKVKFKTVLTPEIVVRSGDLLGDSTTKEMTEELLNYVKKVEAQKSVLPKPKADPKKKSRQKVLAAKDHETLHAAQKYKPQVEECVLSMETQWHCRWKVSYPCDVPPFSSSAPYDDKDPKSCRAALYQVLRWVWHEHTLKTEEVCPWNLEG
jgi:hypothetical protein